jgi:hypothetical protein
MLISPQHDPRMAQDALQESALAGLRILDIGEAPDDEVHSTTDVIGYRITNVSEPHPVDVPDEQHVDVAVGRIKT